MLGSIKGKVPELVQYIQKYRLETFGSSANTMSVKRYFSTAPDLQAENHKAGSRIFTNPQLEFVPADDSITASCYKLREENYWAKQQFTRF